LAGSCANRICTLNSTEVIDQLPKILTTLGRTRFN
jgi:hypothetical protein